ncbi:hypothetical protein C8Q74DRAFT_1221828 [Fomes fomentarius]|nr:hypothetical protein C8Q74DRAFT_1221828 [Fomes fomentarius]
MIKYYVTHPMGVTIERARKRCPSNTGYDRLELFSSRRDRKARTSPLDGRATPGKSGYGVDKLNAPPPYHENTTTAMNVANEVVQPPRTSHAVAAVPNAPADASAASEGYDSTTESMDSSISAIQPGTWTSAASASSAQGGFSSVMNMTNTPTNAAVDDLVGASASKSSDPTESASYAPISELLNMKDIESFFNVIQLPPIWLWWIVCCRVCVVDSQQHECQWRDWQ